MRWRAKFSHISPVWYQIRWNGTDFTLSGQHDVDAGWMARLKLPAEPVCSGGSSVVLVADSATPCLPHHLFIGTTQWDNAVDTA